MITRRSAARLLAAVVVLVSSACAMTIQTLHARLYDLGSAEVINATMLYSGSGTGPVAFDLSDGQHCTGEYVTVPEGLTSWGSVFARVHSPSGSATASGKSSMQTVQNSQNGSAVVSCPGGRVFNCEYVVGRSNQGYGACNDNYGQQFKLMF